jgi:hypothetical protein
MIQQAQTPAQRRANEKHAKSVEKRMGKPETAYKKKESKKSPLGIAAVGKLSSYLFHRTGPLIFELTVLLIFVVVAPLLIEQFKLLPAAWEFFMTLLSKIGLVSR